MTLRPVTDDDARRVTRLHLRPEQGSPYWLERDLRLGAGAYEQVDGWDAAQALLALRDPADQDDFEDATRRRPLEDFVPRPVLDSGEPLWAAQTGGTTGLPKHGTWGAAYWREILEFSDEFLDLHGVPRGENWLFIGPMGPHTTGRLVVAYAERRGGRCLSVDLDPRIVKVFGAEGMAAAYDRYVKHIWDQAEAVIRHQRVGVLFCTSRLLEMLPEYLDPKLFQGVRAVVHAGTTMEPETQRILRTEVFPGVPVVGFYGTSTTGISFQKPMEDADDDHVVYVPSSPFIRLDVIDDRGNDVPYGTDGRVRVWRLTDDQLLPGFWERDRGIRVEPYGAVADRYPWPWLGDPYSPEFTVEGKVEGVY